MTPLELDCVVVGGGVIGLAVARELAMRGRAVTLLEAEARLGEHTSSRNSEVIHAGLYYPNGSLKARTCVMGKRMLYRYAEENGIAHRRTGKLLVATTEHEVPRLEAIFAGAKRCGVNDLRWLDGNDVRALEPEVRAVRALLSPSSGIVDSHDLMRVLQRDAREHGAEISTRSRVTSGAVRDGGFELELQSQTAGEDPIKLSCRSLVNAAGLGAQALASSIRGIPADSIPELHLAKGNYFTLDGAAPFSHLVYPMPVSGGLGIHVTLDLSGRAKFGPDVEWVGHVDYQVDEKRAAAFADAIRSYYPALDPNKLAPAYAGVRPKLHGPAQSADFCLQTHTKHGVPRLINLYGIESPGLTASLALAELVAMALTH